ncbi:hypothetical protein J3R30DRAFT_3702772 [Lentinula aciculospora]|uniref:Uncharacterized protein n=1 Tax=Lentinula aciculospora TaxID=153920 RepID=A0A9W9DP03_9AGAR|nr:hypothetical protein J3R30DRAFT_3702772 [Lentinula aciculospora]
MLIRLIPSASQPTVLFKLVFQNLPETLQTPIAWVNHLAALDSDDLEIPELMHALDKAVGVQTILEQVVFDLLEQKIKCVFFDGDTEEWDIGSCYQGLLAEEAYHRKVDLVRRLDSVIDDVNESAAEMDRERKREEQQKEQQKMKEEGERLEAAKQTENATFGNSLGRKSRPGHKKQRSLLMNLVSSFLPLSLNSPRSPRSPRSTLASSPSTPRSTSPVSSIRSSRSDKVPSQTNSAPTLSRSSTLPSRPVSTSSLSLSPLAATESPIVIVAPPPPPPLSPRALRRRARSSLVDTFRLYVLPELNWRIRSSHLACSPKRIPVAVYGSDTFAPYYNWIVGSTLKRVDLRLSEIAKELKTELDAIGIELSSLPLEALAGLGIGSVASVELHIPTTPCSLPSLSGGSSEGDALSHSETEGDPADIHDADDVSEVTLIDPTASSTGHPTTVHYRLPKPSSCGNSTPSVIALPPSMYLRTSSSSDILIPASLAPKEVSLPESLNELLIQHNDFSSLHLRLAHLLLASHTRTATAVADVAQREAILEVRGRRRSWLNGALKVHGSCDGSTKSHPVNWTGAMASPFRSSGLSKYCYSSDEWECDPYHYLKTSRLSLSTLVTEVYPNPFDYDGENGRSAYLFGHRRKRSVSESNVSLFPVCEEEFVDAPPGGPSVRRNSFGHRRYFDDRRYFDVEIDEDDEDDEDGEDTDVDALVDIEFDEPEDDMHSRPSRPFLQLDKYNGADISKSPSTSGATGVVMHMDAKFPKSASDLFDGLVDNFAAPLALVAAANITKRIKNDSKAEALSDNISEVISQK